MITRYWPEEEPEVYGNFTLSTLKRTSKGPYIEREIEMNYNKVSLTCIMNTFLLS